MAKQYIGVPDAAFRLHKTYRATLDLLFSGKLRGLRHGRNWRVELASVQALEDGDANYLERLPDLDRAS
jgi:hypothetical protein